MVKAIALPLLFGKECGFYMQGVPERAWVRALPRNMYKYCIG